MLGWMAIAGCGGSSGMDSAPTGPKLPELPAEFAAGKAIYDSGCASCHDSSRDGAPRLGYLSAWTRRLAQGEPLLVQHAIEGLDLMPAKGGNENLTEDEIGQAVRYMIYRAELDIPVKHS